MNQTVQQILQEALDRIAKEYGIQINSLDAKWEQQIGLPPRLIAVGFQARTIS